MILNFSTDQLWHSTLKSICSFVQGQLSRSKVIRVIFGKADSVKINEYREGLHYAMQKFEVGYASTWTGCFF